MMTRKELDRNNIKYICARPNLAHMAFSPYGEDVMLRNTPIAVDEVYHLYNRGNQKQTLFFSDRDYARMLFLMLYFQSPEVIRNTKRWVDKFMDKGDFGVDVQDIIDSRYVELINFCIMPNHFHMTVRNLSDNGISQYLHRLQTGYSSYFNTKYEKSGHVFQGAYKSNHVDTDEQLQYLSAYIHKNPVDIPGNTNYESYKWSSFTDYVGKNRWGDLIRPGIILDGYSSPEKYRSFVSTSTAKNHNDFE